MLDQSLIKSNFIGKDGFIWWIGQIPPEDTHKGQINGGGWGNRYKVRILGYDSPNPSDLTDDDVRWAQVMLPTTAGSGAANQSTSVAISPGDTVFGFFLDGAPDYSVPIILGVFGRTSQVSTNEYSRPFQPYTGYTSKVDNDGANIVKNESNENNTNSQKSPRTVPPKLAEDLKSTNPDERSAFDGIGDIVKFASAGANSTVDKMSVEINNFVNKIQTLSDDVSNAVGSVRAEIDAEIAKITAKIQKISTGIVNGIVNGLYNTLKPVLNAGLKLLYKTVYAIVFAATQNDKIAHQAGVAAQRAMISPVEAIEKALPCVANTIINGLSNTISGILSSLAENVTNFVTCISNQVIGGLVNHIIGGVESIISPLLGAVDTILMGFNLINSLRGNAEALLGGGIALSCNEVASNQSSSVNEWVIGKGPKQETGIPVSDIMQSANDAAALATSFIDLGQEIGDLAQSIGSLDFLDPNFSVDGFQSAISDCFGGPPSNCGGTQVKIFGSNGVGAVANAVLGSIVGEGASATGSVIGIDILDGGSGYDFPPFVEIVDGCNQGYGAIGRAVIDYDENSPTYQQVIDIYMVSEGENYPLSDPQETPESKPPYVIDTISIINPGQRYTNSDVVIDQSNPSVEYKVKVNSQGQIIQVFPINSQVDNVVEVKDLPRLKVKSQTGYGAKLKARLKPRRPYQGSIKQQIDCISK